MSKRPEPETKVAVLENDSGAFTRHVYSDTVETTIPVTHRAGSLESGDAWLHIFRCEETGSVRAWGVEDRPRA